jgi:pimeloyl-ACP methyl ester carboxylesterase
MDNLKRLPSFYKRSYLQRAGRIVGILVVFLAIISGLTWTLGSKAKADLAAKYPPPGQMVDVGGYRIHIYCQGEGSPTVVMDAGAGDFSLTWALVQPEVAELTRVCVYDRAGLGWSELSPKSRTAHNIVEELHTLLTKAGIEGPYVLVGQSMGGLHMRLYAHEYTDEIVGMVLIDATPDERDSRFPEAYVQALEHEAKKEVRLLHLAKLLNTIGLLALFDWYPDQYLPGLPQATRETYKGVILSDTKYFEGAADEVTSHAESRAQVQAAQIITLGDIPLVVLTRGASATSDTSDLPAEAVQQRESIWREMQAELAALSTSGKLIIAEQSSHNIHHDQPELVIDAIRQVVEAVRRK